MNCALIKCTENANNQENYNTLAFILKDLNIDLYEAIWNSSLNGQNTMKSSIINMLIDSVSKELEIQEKNVT